MEYSDKVAYLSQYVKLKQHVDYLSNKMYGVKAVSFGEVKGHSNRTVIDDIVQLDQYKSECDIIYNCIHSLDDTTERVVLDYVYIRGESLASISSEGKGLVHYCYRQIRRIHHNAIEHLDI